MIADILESIGSLWGDQREYLTCEKHGGEFAWTEDAPMECPAAGCELVVHVPHGEALMIRWLCWKNDLRWWPQRFYIWSSAGENYRYWRWLGREWLRRPCPDPLDPTL